MTDDKPFTPETLAERWECTPKHIRALTKRGELPHFTLGKLIRIPAECVRKIEHGASNSTGGTGTR